MTKPRIWIDVDGVLAQFVPAYLEMLREHTGRVHAVNDVVSFSFSECVSTRDEDVHIWSKMVDARPGLVLGLQEVEGARGAVESLRMIARVGALTSPHLGPHWMYERARWLMDLGFAKREIIFAADKSHVAGDVLIDDSADNCTAWQAANTSGLALLFDAPWNRAASALPRALDWPDAVRIVRARLGQA